MAEKPTYYVICAERQAALGFILEQELDPARMELLSRRDDGVKLRGVEIVLDRDKIFSIAPLPAPYHHDYLMLLVKERIYDATDYHCDMCFKFTKFDDLPNDGLIRCADCRSKSAEEGQVERPATPLPTPSSAILP